MAYAAVTGLAGARDVDAAAVSAYRFSLDIGRPMSEGKLAAMFGKSSRRWARHRMTEARQADGGDPADGRDSGLPGLRAATGTAT